MDKNIIKKAVTGIEFTEESKQRIFEGFERKKTLKKNFYMKRITVGVIVIMVSYIKTLFRTNINESDILKSV